MYFIFYILSVFRTIIIIIFRQVLPALSKFLCNSATESYGKSSESMYKFTQTYKLQKELLCTLGQMTKNLHFHERETFNVLSIVEPYLDKHQNFVLQVNFDVTNIFTYKCCFDLYYYFTFIGMLYTIVQGCCGL